MSSRAFSDQIGAVYVAGILVFAVGRAFRTGTWRSALAYGALFGFFAYGTYDLTNLTTLWGWPLDMTVVDMAWGTCLTALSATVGFLAARQLAPRTPVG